MNKLADPIIVTPVEGSDREWTLIASIRYKTSFGQWRVPRGFVTDFASIPKFIWSLYPPHGQYTRAAIIHDYLYQDQLVARKIADQVFKEQMQNDGVSWFTRNVFYLAVRTFGGPIYEDTGEGKKRRQRLKKMRKQVRRERR